MMQWKTEQNSGDRTKDSGMKDDVMVESTGPGQLLTPEDRGKGAKIT